MLLPVGGIPLNTRSVVFVAAALTCLWPQAADAHLVVSGMGPIYDGISHFGLSPEDFLPVATLALFAGLKGPRQSRRAPTTS